MTSLEDLRSSIHEDNSRTPLYQRLRRAMRKAIETNSWQSADALPAERDIAEALQVSRITVRKAVDGLVKEGLLTRRQGAGTFVSDRIEKNFAKLTSFTEDMISRGRTPRSEWIKRQEGSVTPEEALMLALSPGSSVYRFHRIRYADDTPMALEYTTIPASCLDTPESVDASLYAALDQAGCRPTRALQRLRAVSFTEDQAKLLGVEPGDPGLLIERRGFTQNGTPVEITRSHYRGDAYDFVAELGLNS